LSERGVREGFDGAFGREVLTRVDELCLEKNRMRPNSPSTMGKGRKRKKENSSQKQPLGKRKGFDRTVPNRLTFLRMGSEGIMRGEGCVSKNEITSENETKKPEETENGGVTQQDKVFRGLRLKNAS